MHIDFYVPIWVLLLAVVYVAVVMVIATRLWNVSGHGRNYGVHKVSACIACMAFGLCWAAYPDQVVPILRPRTVRI